MQKIGTISTLQIQTDQMKRSSGTEKIYDPTPLREVTALQLLPQGVIGLTADGGRLIDVHHVAHPNSRYRGDNGISFNFSPHYDSMIAHFGDHLAVGCAAENIIIHTDQPWEEAAFANGLVLEGENGRFHPVHTIISAPPCLPFSSYALGDKEKSGSTIKAALQFLSNGIRGFYGKVEVSGGETAVIHVGNAVYLP